MFGDYINNFLIFGLSYFVVITLFIIVFRGRNTTIYTISIIIGFTIYGLTFIPAFNSNLTELSTNYSNRMLLLKNSPTLLTLLFANLFILFITLYKRNYLESYRKYIVLLTLITYFSYTSSLISLEVELFCAGGLFISSLAIILYRINQEDKENKKYNGKNHFTSTRRN
jgi:hypothetical protein